MDKQKVFVAWELDRDKKAFGISENNSVPNYYPRGHQKVFGFYSEYKWETENMFGHRNDMISFTCLKCHSAFIENRPYLTKSKPNITVAQTQNQW